MRLRVRFVFTSVGPSLALAMVCGLVTGCTTQPEVPRAPAMPIVGEPRVTQPADARERSLLARLVALANDDRVGEAIAQLGAVAEPAVRARVGVELVDALAEGPTERLAAVAAQLPAGAGQAAALERAARTLTRRDAPAALRWSLALSDPALASHASRAVVTQWIEIEPRAATDAIVAQPESDGREALLGIAAGAWARRDADRALQWARTQSDEARRLRLTLAIGFTLAQREPRRALAIADSLAEGRDRWLLVSASAQTLVATDRANALAWARSLPEGAARDAAYAGIDTGLGVPVQRRVAGGPTPRAVGSRGLGGGVALSPDEPREFADWLATQPAGLSRDEALVEFVRQRGALDSGAIGQWLASLPGSATRDRAREIYLEGRLAGSPSDAANWLRTLPRSDVSDGMVEQVARRWLLTNPEAAEPWLRESRLPEFQKDRLLREAGR